MLEESMPSLQDDVSSMSKMVEQKLEAIQCRPTMNTLMKEVEHEVLELKNEGHSTVIEHDELNIGFQQDFRVADHDKVVRNEKGVSISIDIGIGLEVGVRVVLDVEDELKLESSESLPFKSYATLRASIKFEDDSTILL
ncbi:hypothetical protein J1N35_014924 [Gossypium stocksii]|uniref:Uncharacterized protein n=1 Tax=Gossypium stocksii TaxID=47602 RepID=A0A9D3VVS1_9ROSI|nr:hypothetical protein J1N35_014924 [Gossypium stocksii]